MEEYSKAQDDANESAWLRLRLRSPLDVVLWALINQNLPVEGDGSNKENR